MGNITSRWREMVGSQSLDDYLADRFGDELKFKISKRTYRGGDKTSGSMLPANCFVLSGKCRYSFGEARFDLTEGDYCELPGGQYFIEVPGDSVCTTVRVYKIPPEAWIRK